MTSFNISNARIGRQNFLSALFALAVMTSLIWATSIVHAQSPDFALNSTPSVLCVNPGVDGVSAISLQSVNGFAGTVDLGASVDPTVSNGPTLSPVPQSETLVTGQTVSFNLALSTTSSTPDRVYYVTVSGFSGGILHQATVQLTVAAGCSVGGVVVPAVGLAPASSYLVFGLVVAGLVGIVGATIAIRMSRRKLSPNL